MPTDDPHSCVQSSGLRVNGHRSEALTADKVSETYLTYPLLGQFGETGTLLAVATEKQREKISYSIRVARTVAGGSHCRLLANFDRHNRLIDGDGPRPAPLCLMGTCTPQIAN